MPLFMLPGRSSGSMNQSLSKAMVVLIVITVTVCIYLEFGRSYSKLKLNIHSGLYSRHSISNQSNSFQGNEVYKEQRKKIFLAFFYWEQLSMATNNLLHLTALATHGGRQVVVPFVKDSQFRGVATTKRYQTLGLYYNVTALNETLRSHGHGTLISWKDFQDFCKGSLDVLVYFEYSDLKNTTTYSLATPYVPCKLRRKNTFHGIRIVRRVCVNVNALDSIKRFEDEVLERLPCVGILEWRGTSKTVPYRTHFNIALEVGDVMSYRDTNVFFSSKLLYIARDFIAKNLAPDFISVHIRTEQLLSTGKSLSDVRRCLSKLRIQIQAITQVATVHTPVFLATDFTEFGSSSKKGVAARKHAKSLMKILVPLKPVVFQPSEYKVADKGAVAIVEMNILSSGKRLVVVGGGTFQYWIITQFLNNNEQRKVERFAC